MDDTIKGILIWVGVILASVPIPLALSRPSGDSERRKTPIPALLIILTMGYFLGWSVSERNLTVAFLVFIVGAVLLSIYYRKLERRGYVLQDERTLRIEEVASRRTLQATMLFPVALSVYLSVEKTMNPELDLASKVVSAILILVFMLHWGCFTTTRG
jgi:uncharacterized membrane protein